MRDDEQKQRHEQWQKIIEIYLQSGMTQKAFCEHQNISLPKFVYYYGYFRRDKESQITQPAFASVNISSSDKLLASNEIKLSLPNGFQCTFPSHTDVSQIKRLIEVLLSC